MTELRKTERDLVVELKACREKADKLDAELKAAKELRDKAEAALIELLEANTAESTAKYDGIGKFTLLKPRLYASVTEENRDTLLSFLKKIKRADLIKTTVMPQTLSTFVKERIDNGEQVPEFIGNYLKSSLRYQA